MRDILTRLWQTPIVLWVIITLSFVMTRLAPGSPFGAGERDLAPEVVATLEKQYGLDGNILSQYVRYMGNLLQGDLGPSLHQQHQSVASIIGNHLPFTKPSLPAVAGRSIGGASSRAFSALSSRQRP